ncbi:DinB family protein [Polaribacter porphyrae]|uniref:Damage-inducible protein DinB n=1 Tax=Polaribacter porphyrae TaxID=1137780 RepID=A0A2S7WJZ7_9FLAO|nr:DinB family protein [Polaribacter porphyrae]PQJ77924.1 damage-inducible protein DinB [Polaribacter porphyrae]
MIPKNEYAPYFEQYISLIVSEEKSILENLIDSQKEFDTILRNLPKEKNNFAYAKGKWTLKELIQHIIDTERIFCYRALCFARNDTTELPGFDQDVFVANDTANDREFKDLLDEMTVLRNSTVQLYQSFSEEALLRIGIASGNKMSVRALGYLFAGHQIHHLNIIKERYL